jgi:hypothetical protein
MCTFAPKIEIEYEKKQFVGYLCGFALQCVYSYKEG